jgi:hypothetical protein
MAQPLELRDPTTAMPSGIRPFLYPSSGGRLKFRKSRKVHRRGSAGGTARRRAAAGRKWIFAAI